VVTEEEEVSGLEAAVAGLMQEVADLYMVAVALTEEAVA
jgi:hypothetical protein